MPVYYNNLSDTFCQNIICIISGDLWPLSRDDASYSDEKGDAARRREKGLVGWEKGFRLTAGNAEGQCTPVVISRAFFLFFPYNHIINIKKNLFSAKYKAANFSPFFLPFFLQES